MSQRPLVRELRVSRPASSNPGSYIGSGAVDTVPAAHSNLKPFNYHFTFNLVNHLYNFLDKIYRACIALHHLYFLEYTSDIGLGICSASLLPVLQQCFSSTWTVAVLHLYLDFPEYNMATAASGAATASLDQ